ncbi:mechanosensitive ion channel family protein [Candidatus Peregrinibacteria bacterium]|nr:MAG: mechanosensitive ion channel family protein [Candidatus Peregrinibacteria bacterium]
MLKFVLWSIAVLMILSNLGINVSALITGLGIGGIAVALAVQTLLSDLFSSFSIYFDKPFEVGDFVVIGEHSGTIKRIGLKTTRIQALGGEELVLSNHELTNTRIQNFKRMQRRRILFSVGVVYGTTTDQLKKIPEIIKDIIDTVALADFDRAHFKHFGDFSLVFEIVYFLNSKEYVDYMNTQQSINLALREAFEKEHIEMAFPTQTVYVQKVV